MSIQAITCAMALREVTPSEKLLLLALANYADENMRCYPSQRKLAEDTCLSDRTIRSLLAALEARRMLSRQERTRPDGSRGTDLFTLHFAGMVFTSISGGAEMTSGGVGKPLPGGGEMVSALTTFEPSPEPSDEPVVVIPLAPPEIWMARLEEARSALGDALDPTATGIMHARDLRALCEPQSGEPCTWGEVLDAVRMCAARQKGRGKPLRTFAWVKDDALALRDKRLNSDLPEPSRTHERPHTDKLAAKDANLARAFAGADTAADFLAERRRSGF